jgi:hypothetical protein
LFAVTAMLICYALEDRSHWFVLAFAGACALGSAYRFLQGRVQEMPEHAEFCHAGLSHLMKWPVA